MSKNTSITLGEYFDAFLENEVKKGQFKNKSEVIRAGLRLLEIQQNKIEAINKALVEGEESGYIENFDNDEFLEKMKIKYGDQL